MDHHALPMHVIIQFTGQLLNVEYSDVSLPLPSIPILLDDVICTGSETSLVQCSHNGFNEHNCYHNEDIVIECIGKRSI